MTPTNPRPPETPDPIQIVATLTGRKGVRIEIDGKVVVVEKDMGKGTRPGEINTQLSRIFRALPTDAPVEVTWVNETAWDTIDICHRDQAIVRDTVRAFEQMRSGAMITPTPAAELTVGSTGRRVHYALGKSPASKRPPGASKALTNRPTALDAGPSGPPSLGGNSPSAPMPGPTEKPEQPSGPAVAAPAAKATSESAVDHGRRGVRLSGLLATWFPTRTERQLANDASALLPESALDRTWDNLVRRVRGLPSVEEERVAAQAAANHASMAARVRPELTSPAPVGPDEIPDMGATNYGHPDDFKARLLSTEEAEAEAAAEPAAPVEVELVGEGELLQDPVEPSPGSPDDFAEGEGPTHPGTTTQADPAEAAEAAPEPEPPIDTPPPAIDPGVAEKASALDGILGAAEGGTADERRAAKAAQLGADLGVGGGSKADAQFKADGSLDAPPPSGRYQDVVDRQRRRAHERDQLAAATSARRRTALMIAGLGAVAAVGVVGMVSIGSQLKKTMFPDAPQTASNGMTDASNASSSASTPTTPDAPASPSGATEAAPITHTVEMNLGRVWSGDGHDQGRILSAGGDASVTVAGEAGLWQTGKALADALDVSALDGKKGLLTHQTNKRVVSTVGGQVDLNCEAPVSTLLHKMDAWGDGKFDQNWDDSGWGPVVDNIRAAGLQDTGICDVAQHVDKHFPNANAGTWMLGEAALLDGHPYLSHRLELPEDDGDGELTSPKQQHDELMAAARTQVGPTMETVAKGIIRGEITRPVLPEKKTEHASLQRINPGEYAEQSTALRSSSKAVTFVPKAKQVAVVTPTDAPDVPIGLRMKRPASQPFDHIDISKVTAEPKAQTVSVARRTQVKAQAPSRTAQEAFGGFIPSEKVLAQAPIEKTVIARQTTPKAEKKSGGFFSGIADGVKKAARWARWKLG